MQRSADDARGPKKGHEKTIDFKPIPPLRIRKNSWLNFRYTERARYPFLPLSGHLPLLSRSLGAGHAAAVVEAKSDEEGGGGGEEGTPRAKGRRGARRRLTWEGERERERALAAKNEDEEWRRWNIAGCQSVVSRLVGRTRSRCYLLLLMRFFTQEYITCIGRII